MLADVFVNLIDQKGDAVSFWRGKASEFINRDP